MTAKPSYAWAFLTHRRNAALVLGMSALAMLLSYPFGGDGAVAGMLLLAALETIGLATVPALPAFQRWVDREAASSEGNAARERLLDEIDRQGGSSHFKSYEMMCDRVASLRRTAADRASSLSDVDVDTLDQLTVDYLRMLLSDAAVKAAKDADVAGEVQRMLKAVEQRLQQQDIDKDEEQQLRRVQVEYREALARQARMISRRSSLEAQLISMPLRMEEVYQMVMTSPSAGDLRALLDESVSKLRIAEEVAMDVDDVVLTHADAATRRNDAAKVAGRTASASQAVGRE